MARLGPSSRLLRAAVAVVICCTASDCQDVHPRQRPGGLRRRNVWSCASDVLLLCKGPFPVSCSARRHNRRGVRGRSAVATPLTSLRATPRATCALARAQT